MTDEVKETTERGLKLRSITIHSFRQVKPETKLEFASGMNVILGENATGKSTLLELISACVRGNFDAFAKEAFDVEFVLEWQKSRWEYHVKVDERLLANPREQAREWRRWSSVVAHDADFGEVRFDFDGGPPGARRAGDSWQRLEEAPSRDPIRAISPFRVRELSASVANRPPEFGIPGEPPSGRCDEGLQWLLGHLSLQPKLWWGANENASPVVYSATLAPFFAEGRSGAKNVESLAPVVTVSQDSVMAAVARELGFTGLALVFNPATADHGTLVSTLARFVFERGQTRRLLEELSYGQQRLFALAWYMALSEDVLVIDELVNGLHERWIEWCVRQFGDRQVFLTSQNRVLVDLLPFASDVDFRTAIKRCTLKIEADSEQWQWSPLTEFEASTVKRALQERHSESVTEVLRALRLW